VISRGWRQELLESLIKQNDFFNFVFLRVRISNKSIKKNRSEVFRTMPLLSELSQKAATALNESNHILVTAESCTGGGIAAAITDVSGSSAWFDRAFVTYSNEAKMDMVDVKPKTLNIYGAVSQETVEEMAAGALKNSLGTVAISVSGIAGPTGGTDDKPVGTVWFGWKIGNLVEEQERVCFSGSREEVRTQASCHALAKLIELLD
jgi:nicotinamide-nucleotide amidase